MLWGSKLNPVKRGVTFLQKKGGLKLLKKWGLGFSDMQSLSRKQLYEQVLSSFFVSSLSLKHCPSEVMGKCIKFLNEKRLHGKFFNNERLALQRKLFVRGNLSVVNSFCPWDCEKEETVDHFLLECSVSKALYEQVLTTLGTNFCKNTYGERAYGIVTSNHPLDKETLFVIFCH
ncbi:hypothetical protein XELAEV_18006051mg [Xenopus laevis]|uniref:Reverse transcriptase zinc-binding domain-containing protein n=1 Tax=Xenopus laevis TaxID=8355 RepID=A0A974DYU7_XENLA|nr:hypothetical protein XELAEV_18006051mg [Xenopus laevis]